MDNDHSFNLIPDSRRAAVWGGIERSLDSERLQRATEDIYQPKHVVQITELHAKGGHGEVYKGQVSNQDEEKSAENLTRQVAVKIVRFEKRDNENIIERLRRESSLMEPLQHPAIMPVLFTGTTKDTKRPFYVMPFVEGENLDDVLTREQHFPNNELIRSLIQVAHGVDFAHSNRVIHRDIKPKNIIIGKHNNVYLADWGLAKSIDETSEKTTEIRTPQWKPPVNSDDVISSGLTIDGTILGTPGYMSPEQMSGGRLGCASDIYALGVILYQIATGCDVPSQRSNGAHQFNWPSSTNSSLCAIISKATNAEPAKRFESAREFADALQNWLEDKPIQHGVIERPLAIVSRWLRNHQATMSSIAAALVVLLIVGSFAFQKLNAQNTQLQQLNSDLDSEKSKVATQRD